MSDTELPALSDGRDVAPTDGRPQSLLGVIARAASDPTIDVAKMERLLDVQERMMAKQAEINFSAALADVQADLPIIQKSGKIVHNGKRISDYAKFEDIMRAVRPLLASHGFAVTFNSQETTSKIVISGTLAHRDGHSVTNTISLPLDTSGAKNNVQGVGSTISYGKRYVVGMLLNLVFEGEDDDGRAGGAKPITDEHAAELKKLLEDTGADVAKFLTWVGADNVDAMDEGDYQKARQQLLRRKQQQGAT